MSFRLRSASLTLRLRLVTLRIVDIDADIFLVGPLAEFPAVGDRFGEAVGGEGCSALESEASKRTRTFLCSAAAVFLAASKSCFQSMPWATGSQSAAL